MNHTTYSLRPEGAARTAYAKAIARLADDLMVLGEPLRPLVSDYGWLVESIGLEARRTHDEYLLEALLLGVLWRARGHEALAFSHRRADVLRLLASERRSGCGRRRDGSNAVLLSWDVPKPCATVPSLAELDHLFDWLLATGEYDDELARLRGGRTFLMSAPAKAPGILSDLASFSARRTTRA